MKRHVSILALILLAAAFSAGGYAAVDLTGTWVGTTEVPGYGDDDITLVLDKEGDSYKGTVSDSAGMVDETEIQDVEWEDGTLSFTVTIFNGQEYMDVSFTLTVSGDKMSGYWETEDGSSGSIELEREK